jgi:hypothetical protein
LGGSHIFTHSFSTPMTDLRGMRNAGFVTDIFVSPLSS